MASWRFERLRTGLGDADAHIAALELGAGQVERLLQAVERAEFDVAKALGLAIELVLDDAHVGDLAVGEEVVDIALGGVEGEVAQMGRVRGLRGEGELLASREAALGCGGELACIEQAEGVERGRTKAVGAGRTEATARAVRGPVAAVAATAKAAS